MPPLVSEIISKASKNLLLNVLTNYFFYDILYIEKSNLFITLKCYTERAVDKHPKIW